MTCFVLDLLGKLWDEEVKRRDVGILGTEGESLRWGWDGRGGASWDKELGERKRRTSEDMGQKEERGVPSQDVYPAMPGMNKIFPSAFLLRHQLKPSGPTSHFG